MKTKERIGKLIQNRQLRGQVFYDPKSQRLFQVKHVQGNQIITGDFCSYYGDARRSSSMLPLLADYLKDCVPVNTLDKMPMLTFDGMGWKVKEDLTQWVNTVKGEKVNIEPICQTAMRFLTGNVFRPSLGTVTNIGEICEIDWYEGVKQEKAGSIFVTIDDPRVVGFKRVKDRP